MTERAASYRLRRIEPSEALVLNAVLRYLRVETRVAWAHRFNSGATKIPGVGGRPDRFLRFAFKGCPDVLGQLTDGRLLAVECKRPGGRRRPEQRAFLALVTQAGGVACFAESVEDVKKAVLSACAA